MSDSSDHHHDEPDPAGSRRHGTPGEFATNWKEFDGPFAKKVALTVRNLVLKVPRGGCCRHPGEPGC